ncbi:uncharacterized protein LOC121730519 isoform X2 [Aricia agestis]|uniref:uncharacterized protein LOC121730519 isoform X2 n=1 Tax=Aricia agestis TaxID=91739 RepID=UPI001C202DFF|nr:uncharacterized protein LOC121730519 isoform X2 [Aricia agestis]
MDDFERKAPRSAIALYIKMYSKQKKQNKKGTSLITEAAKSWLSLSEAEKNEFSNKYKECKLLLRKKVANQLKNIQPYMKKKRKTNSDKFSSDCIEDLNNTSNISCDQNETKTLEENNLNCVNNVLSTLEEYNLNCDLNLSKNFHQNRIIGSPEHNFKYKTLNDMTSGQQLFDMIQKDDNKTWAELLPSQRRQYQTAVLSIKKNYLKEYKSYLESLSTVNLLEHYRNVKNELV